MRADAERVDGLDRPGRDELLTGTRANRTRSEPSTLPMSLINPEIRRSKLAQRRRDTS
jgi:hypothetical protein